MEPSLLRGELHTVRLVPTLLPTERVQSDVGGDKEAKKVLSFLSDMRSHLVTRIERHLHSHGLIKNSWHHVNFRRIMMTKDDVFAIPVTFPERGSFRLSQINDWADLWRQLVSFTDIQLCLSLCHFWQIWQQLWSKEGSQKIN